jgi:protein TonB
MLRPARESANPTSVVLAVLVHAAIAGIVWGLALGVQQPAPPPPDPEPVWTIPLPQSWTSDSQGPRGSGPREQGPKVITEPQPPPPDEPPVATEPTEAPPSVESDSAPPEGDDATGGERGVGGDATGDGEGPGDGDGPGDGTGPGVGGTGSGSAAAGRPEPTEAVRLTSDMVHPVLVRRVEPEYPARCRRAGIRGTVILECVIGEDGRVTVDEVLQSVPCLDDVAREAVEDWRYEPALWNGRPQAVLLVIRLTFR